MCGSIVHVVTGNWPKKIGDVQRGGVSGLVKGQKVHKFVARKQGRERNSKTNDGIENLE